MMKIIYVSLYLINNVGAPNVLVHKWERGDGTDLEYCLESAKDIRWNVGAIPVCVPVYDWVPELGE